MFLDKDMKLKNILLLVADIEKSKYFYTKLFGLFVVKDFDTKVILSEGLVLQDRSVTDPELNTLRQGVHFILYFECFNIEEFTSKLDSLGMELNYLHNIKEEYGQKIVRIYDPDANLVEVREINYKENVMSKKIDVFYEFTCPFCYRGLEDFYAIVEGAKDVEVNFMPCETNPLPNYAPVHSDKAAEIVYFLKSEGLDAKTFNDLVYEAHFEKKLRIDDENLLTEFAVSVGADADSVKDALSNGTYSDILKKNNELVWNELSLGAVPSYRLGDKLAASRAGVLVSAEDIKKLIED